MGRQVQVECPWKGASSKWIRWKRSMREAGRISIMKQALWSTSNLRVWTTRSPQVIVLGRTTFHTEVIKLLLILWVCETRGILIGHKTDKRTKLLSRAHLGSKTKWLIQCKARLSIYRWTRNSLRMTSNLTLSQKKWASSTPTVKGSLKLQDPWEVTKFRLLMTFLNNSRGPECQT